MISASLDAWLRLSSIQPKTRIVIRYRRRRDTNGDHAPGCSSGQTAGGSHSSSSEAVQARMLSLQDRELVAQDQDLGGLPRLLTPGQPQPGGHPRDQEEDEAQAHDR